MKLTDYLAQFLADHGVTHAFGMSGGAAVHMFDSIDKHPKMRIISMTHEQCAAMAADGYARSSGRIGVAVTTSGPGATNLLTGTCCSFYDSIPTLMLTGQVATHRLKGERQVRQVGFQETDVVAIFSPITKYAVQVRDPATIRYHLERAYYTAFEGRPGPVLLDIPDDLQRVEIDPEKLEGFTPERQPDTATALNAGIAALLEKISRSKRPVLVLGGGLKTPYVGEALLSTVERLGIPALVTWAGLDLLPDAHPLRIGTFGVYGPRGGNFAVQNADLVIGIGTRLSQNLTGGMLSSFAREAEIVMIDADAHEMTKFDGRGLSISLGIHARAADFITALQPELKNYRAPDWSSWTTKIAHWKKTFVRDLSPQRETSRPHTDACDFVDALSEVLPEGAQLYVDTGGNLTWTCNHFRPKRGQRVFSAWNNTPMGYSLPAAFGAAFFDPARSTTCIIGDGGLMVCLGELATAVVQKLPVKILLFNNHSHGIQKQTLETWLGGRYVGVDPASGLAFPANFARVAEAMGLPVFTIDGTRPVLDELKRIYATPGPVFVNVEINPDQKLYPVVKFGSPLETQLPALDPAFLNEEMIVPLFAPAEANAATRQQAGQGW